MKICIPLRSPASSDLKLDNLRSESRWERQALEACVQSPLVDVVYTLGCSWHGGTAVSSKYKGPLGPNDAADTVLLVQDCNLGWITKYKYKAIIVNIFAGPWVEQLEAISEVVAQYGDRFIFSVGFPVLYRNEGAMSHLQKFLSKDNIVLLPQPGIPRPRYKDCFDNKTLLWAWRLIFFSQITTDPGITWALDKLREDDSLDLYILTGWKRNEVKDLVDGEVVWITENIEDYFWSREEFKPYIDLRSRVVVEYSLSWGAVLDKYSEAKLLAYCGKYFGGPPLEAATFGVPFVGNSWTHGALVDCPGYLVASGAEEASVLLDRLMVDREFYVEKALSYHQYAVTNYTYASFCKNIYSILEERGIV